MANTSSSPITYNFQYTHVGSIYNELTHKITVDVDNQTIKWDGLTGVIEPIKGKGWCYSQTRVLVETELQAYCQNIWEQAVSCDIYGVK